MTTTDLLAGLDAAQAALVAADDAFAAEGLPLDGSEHLVVAMETAAVVQAEALAQLADTLAQVAKAVGRIAAAVEEGPGQTRRARDAFLPAGGAR